MELPDKTVIAGNRDAWNDSARYHKDTEGWRTLVSSVGRADFSCLDQTITSLLLSVGITGKDVVQLGCNNGRESLSLFGLGARSVVGIDQSSAFLDQGRELASHSPHEPEFVEADIHCLPPALHERFDVALITIGVLGWMPDISGFFFHVARTLKTGGTLVIYETHPYLEMFDPETDDPFKLDSSYFRGEPFVQEQAIVYAGTVEGKSPASYWFVHTMSDIISALINAGLQIAHFREYPHCNREELYERYEQQPAQLPLCYTLTAIKRQA